MWGKLSRKASPKRIRDKALFAPHRADTVACGFRSVGDEHCGVRNRIPHRAHQLRRSSRVMRPHAHAAAAFRDCAEDATQWMVVGRARSLRPPHSGVSRRSCSTCSSHRLAVIIGSAFDVESWWSRPALHRTPIYGMGTGHRQHSTLMYARTRPVEMKRKYILLHSFERLPQTS